MFDIVILAGGRGQRLSGYLNGYPKPMVKINNIHFLDYLLFKILRYFPSNIYIIAGYKGNLIKKKYHNKKINISKIKVVVEKNLKGTGGALYMVKKFIKNDFFVINGDSIFDINFYDFIKKFNRKKYIGSIALTKNHNYLDNKKLTSLNLKKNSQIFFANHNRHSLMNGGVYFFRKMFLKYIQNKKLSLENEIIPNLINKKKMSGKIYNKFFLDIGTPKNFKKAKKYFKSFYRPAIFLDRDGTLNHDKKGYTHKLKDLRLIKRTVNFLINKKNYYLFIVTNQAGIAKKKFTLIDFYNFQKNLYILLAKQNIYIDDMKFCPHHKEALIKKYKVSCKCRKPNTKMIDDLLKQWPIIKNKSFMIGDSEKDYIASKKSNLKFIYCKNIKSNA